MKAKVFIDPRCDRRYSAFYIKGLYDLFGRWNVKYSLKYFKTIDMSKKIPSDDPTGGEEARVLLFVIKQGVSIKKIAIDAWDKTYIVDAVYQWADVYAKVNYEKDTTQDKYKAKLLSIPPSFSICYRNYLNTVFDIINGIRLCFFPKILIYKSISRFVRECLMLSRKSLKDYTTHDVRVKSKYIFFVSTYWVKSDWFDDWTINKEYDYFVDKANNERIEYVDMASTLNGIKFEGGIYTPGKQDLFNANGEGISLDRFISTKEYIQKTKQSICVFNTPAVWGCHSWKLAEYMAMGKAIISMPLKNELPEPLTDGKNVVFVNNKDEMKAAIIKIANDDDFREKLEHGASEYYKKYIAPESVIKNIIKHG